MKKILLTAGALTTIATGTANADTWKANAPETMDVQNKNHYIVKWGDTLSALSVATQSDVNTLVSMNSDKVHDPDMIYTQDVLNIPVVQSAVQPISDKVVKRVIEKGTIKESLPKTIEESSEQPADDTKKLYDVLKEKGLSDGEIADILSQEDEDEKKSEDDKTKKIKTIKEASIQEVYQLKEK